MKDIIKKENAIKLLLSKKQQNIMLEIANLIESKNHIQFNIDHLEKMIQKNQSPIKVNSKVDILTIINYCHFFEQTNNSLIKFKEDINIIDLEIIDKQKKLSEIIIQEKIFIKYFDSIKKNKQYILDKKEEAMIQDQYNIMKYLL